MDKRKVEELIRLVEESEIQELEVSGPFTSVRISKAAPAPSARPAVHYEPTALPVTGVEPLEAAAAAAPAEADSGLASVVSPMVGTFYSAPSADSDPYVRQGDHVNSGQVVCIVEAMKLMNEIESEVSGTIVRICVENAQPVEYGQELFLIQPD